MWLCGLVRPRRPLSTETCCNDVNLDHGQQVPGAPGHVAESVAINGDTKNITCSSGSEICVRSFPAPSPAITKLEHGVGTGVIELRIQNEPTDKSKGNGDAILEAVLNQLCYPVTLIDADSVVLLQNDASRRLWGDFVTNRAIGKQNGACPITAELASQATPEHTSLLQVIFASDKDAFLEALAELEEGRVWRGLLQMPSSIEAQASSLSTALTIIRPGSNSPSASVTHPHSAPYLPAAKSMTPRFQNAPLVITKPAPAAAQVEPSNSEHKPTAGRVIAGDAQTRLIAAPNSAFHTFTINPNQEPQESGLHAMLGHDVEACLDTSQSNARGRKQPNPTQTSTSSPNPPSKTAVTSPTNGTLELTTMERPHELPSVLATPEVPGATAKPPVAPSVGFKVTEASASNTATEALVIAGIAILEGRLSQITSETLISSTNQLEGASVGPTFSRSQSRFCKDFGAAFAAALRGDVSSSTVGLLPHLTHSTNQSWGSLGAMSNEPVIRLDGHPLLQVTTTENSAAGSTAMASSAPGASGQETVVEISSGGKLPVRESQRDGTVDSVSPSSHAGWTSWLSKSKNVAPSENSLAPNKSREATVGSLESSWAGPRTRSRRSVASYAPAPISRVNSASCGSTGANRGVEASSPTQMQQQLLAEGLTTSALGTLVRGGSRRAPRRNISAATLMPNSHSGGRSLMLKSPNEGRRMGAFVDSRCLKEDEEEEEIEKTELNPVGASGTAFRSGHNGDGRAGRSQIMSTAEDSFGFTDANVTNAYVRTLGSVDPKGTANGNEYTSYASCFSSLLTTKKDLSGVADGASVGAGGGGLQCHPSGLSSNSRSDFKRAITAAVSGEAVVSRQNTALHLDSHGVVSGMWMRNAELINGISQLGDPPQGGSLLTPSGPNGLMSSYRNLNSGLLSTDASSSSRRESATPSHASNTRPTSAMHRLLSMALTVAGGTTTSASSSRAVEFENVTRALSQTLDSSSPRPTNPHELASRGGGERESSDPSAASLHQPQTPEAPEHVLLPVPSEALSRQDTAVLFRGIQGSRCDPQAPGVSRNSSQNPLSSRRSAVAVADVEVERASIRTSSSTTTAGGGMASSSGLTFTGLTFARQLMSGTSVGIVPEDSTDGFGKQRLSGGSLASKFAAAMMRAEAPMGPMRVAKFGQPPAAATGSHAGQELTFGSAAPRMSISTLEGLLDMRDSDLGTGSKGASGNCAIAVQGAALATLGSSAASAAPAVPVMKTMPAVAPAATSTLGTKDPVEAHEEEQPEVPAIPLSHWHEVTLTSFMHPTLHRPVIMMVQNDVSARVWAERQIARVMEAEHTLLENIFPIHVIQHIAATAAQEAEAKDTPDQSWSIPTPAPKRPPGQLLAAGGSQRGGGFAHPAMSNPSLPLITGGTFLHLATNHSALTVLFCDIQGFTSMCNVVKPATVMAFLNDLYTRLDAMLDVYGVYKVETIGDCYVVAGGLMKVDEATGAVTVRSDDVDPQHAHRTVQFAKALLSAAAAVRLPTTGQPVRMRVGIHSGPAMSGVVGTRMPRFCLFGDTINTASRMESTGVPGAIHVSQATRDLAPGENWEATGGVEAKGKGLLQTYLLKSHVDM